MAEGPTVTATIKDDVPVTTIRMSFDLVGIMQDSDFASSVVDELTSLVHSLAPDTLASFGISATTERDLTQKERDFAGTSFGASRMAAEMWARHAALGIGVEARRLAASPDHVSSVTVALGATLSLSLSAGQADDPEAVRLSLRAEGGTAIGVPTVAVPELRRAGLVL